MGSFIDSIPFSGIIRIRDMMYGIDQPYRLDQGDVSFDAPDSVKNGMREAIAANRSHYLQTTGVPQLQELLAEKLRTQNRIEVASPDEVLVTNGGIHGLYVLLQALLEPGDEVIIPDPLWPPTAGLIIGARGEVVRCPLHEKQGWRFDLDELAACITPRTRAIYINSPHNPTGGVLTRADLDGIAAIAARHGLWVISDEAYEDVVYEGRHESIASRPGMYPRTLSVFTFSKSYAMTGLRLGYVSIQDKVVRERAKKVLFYTTSNVASVVQYGGIAALEGTRDVVHQMRAELQARRDLFYRGIEELDGLFEGAPPAGAFYAFLRMDPEWRARIAAAETAAAGQDAPPRPESASWDLVEFLIEHGRIGCVPGVDFGPSGEGYVRFCFARERREIEGALASMRALFSGR